MTEILCWLIVKLMLATVALSVAWLIQALCLRVIHRPSVQLQAWSSWMPLWQTVLLGTLTIPVVVAPMESSSGPTNEPPIASIESATGLIVAPLPEAIPTKNTIVHENKFTLPTHVKGEVTQRIPVGRYVLVAGAFIWLTGFAAVIGTWLFRYLHFVRYVQTCAEASPEVTSQWHNVLQAWGNRRAIPVVISDDVGPALCRLPEHPVLILPDRSWQSLDSDAQQIVLRHELAHYQRGHLWKMLLARSLAAVHWFNPCAWWSAANLESAYECMADEDAVDDDELSACRLAQTLLDLCPHLPAQTPALAANGSDLKVRIARLIDRTQHPESNMIRYLWISLGCLLTLASMVRVEFVAAQDQPNRPSTSAGQSDAIQTTLPQIISPAASPSASVNSQTFNYRLLEADPPPTYELAAGDRVHIVYEKENVDRDIVLPTDGSIELPTVGSATLKKLTMAEAREKLSKLVAPNPIVLTLRDCRKVNVVVTRAFDAVVEAKTQTIYVSQLVKLPAYQNDVLHAIIENGGLPATPAWRIYIVHKPVGARLKITAIDHRDRRVDPERITLQDGDEVIVHKVTKPQNDPIDMRGIGNFLMVVANGAWEGHSGDDPTPLLDGSFPITEILKLQDKADIDKLPLKSVFQFPFLSAGKLTHTQRYFMPNGELTYDFTLHPKMLMPSLEQMADEMQVGPIFRDIVTGLFEDPKGPRINLAAVCTHYLDNRCQLIVENRWPQLDKPQQLALVLRLKDSTALESTLSKVAELEAGSSQKIHSTNVYSIRQVSYCVNKDRLMIGSSDLVRKLIEPE